MFNKSVDFKTINNGVTFEAPLALPDADNISEAIEQGGETCEALLDFVHAGIRGFARNNVKAGRTMAASWEEVVALRKAAAEAKGGNGEALARQREFNAAYKTYLQATGMKSKGVDLLVRLAGSNKALAAARTDFIEKVQETVLSFAETCDEAALTNYAGIMDNISMIGADDDSVDADLFG